MVKITDGLKLKTDYSYREFGKFIIQYKFLMDNIFLIKYKSYAPVPTLKRQEITDDLKDIIINIFDTGEINYQLGKTLGQNEKNLLIALIDKSGLKEQLKFNKVNLLEDVNDVINDYNVLKGIIIAGNTNPEIIKQLKIVMDKLVLYKKINKKDAIDILNEVS
jgi:hypothetical protein